MRSHTSSIERRAPDLLQVEPLNSQQVTYTMAMHTVVRGTGRRPYIP